MYPNRIARAKTLTVKRSITNSDAAGLRLSGIQSMNNDASNPAMASTSINSFDTSLFAKTTHNPSYASLTKQFSEVNNLRDYCIPVNSYFPPAQVMEKLHEKMGYALKYYPGSNENIAENIATFSGIENPATIIAGNGSTEIISWLNSLFIKESLFVPAPSFGRWIEEPQGLGIELHTSRYQDSLNQYLSPEQLVAEVKQSGARNLVICNPNNPTGSIMSRAQILWVLDQLTELDNIIIDESFIDFSAENPPSIKNDVANYPNAWVLKSLGKNVGLHGLRMGFAISNEANIARLRKHLPYWNVNGITEMLLHLIKDEQATYHESRLKTITDAVYLSERFEELPEFTIFPTHSNFIFVKLRNDINGTQLRNCMLQNHGCFIRNCGNKLGSSEQYFRIAARPAEDVNYLIAALKIELAVLTKTEDEPMLHANLIDNGAV
jgi:histidinol-phosphate/aromatic aminotransferase/cobyric acid decarboxylase-like protein